MTDLSLHDLVLETARRQAAIDQRKAVIEQMIARFEEAYINHYRDELAALNKEADALDSGLRGAALDAFHETGDKAPHPAVTVSMRSKWVYDKGAALEAAQANDPALVRVKPELDIRAFEKAMERGLPWFTADKELIPTVSVGKLGAYLIIDEARGSDDKGSG
jgi:hypothetical protein